MKKPEEKMPMPKAVPDYIKKDFPNRIPKKKVLPVQPVQQPVKKTP